MESANLKFDEYIEVYEAKPMNELEEYKSFVFFYENMLADADVVNQVVNQQQVSVIAESHTMNLELHSGTKLHLGAKLHNQVEAHFDSKISVH